MNLLKVSVHSDVTSDAILSANHCCVTCTISAARSLH